MTRELQSRRKLTQLRDKYGTLQTDPTKIARALQDHWAGIMKPGNTTVSDGLEFLNSLPLPPPPTPIAEELCPPTAAPPISRVGANGSRNNETRHVAWY